MLFRAFSNVSYFNQHNALIKYDKTDHKTRSYYVPTPTGWHFGAKTCGSWHL